MRAFLFIFLSFLISSCTNSPNRVPATTTKPRHVIFTIHGLSGNENTWGYFAPATKDLLEKVDPNFEVIVSNFLYRTGRSEKLSTTQFAVDFDKHVRDTFRDNPITTNDKISIVSHSQGGIIAYMWFFNNLTKEPMDLQYAGQVDSVVTLGTPFWGSKLASILIDPENIDLIPLIKAFGGSEYRMSRREITDMAIGSDVIYSFRKMAVQLDMDPEFAQKVRSLSVRLVNIIGLMPSKDSYEKKLLANPDKKGKKSFASELMSIVYKVYARKKSKDARIESDLAVSVPSGRWNFLYAPPKQITSDTQIQAAEFRDFQNFRPRSKFIFSETVHLPFDGENTFSMAYINQTCLQVETCKHPTFRYILEQLANCPENSCNPQAFNDVILKLKVVNLDQHLLNKGVSATLHSFSVQVGIKLRPGQIDRFPVRYFKKIQLMPEADTETWILNQPELIGKVLNLKHDGQQKSIASNKDFTVYFGKKSETESVNIVSKAATQTEFYDTIRINIAGSIKLKNVDSTKADYRSPESVVVPFEINLPGLPRVKVDALVRPGFSSYIDLDYTNSPE